MLFSYFRGLNSSTRQKLAFLTITLGVAIIERSLLPIFLLFPFVKQQALNQRLKNQLEQIDVKYRDLVTQSYPQILAQLQQLEAESSHLSRQSNHLTYLLKETEDKNQELAQKVQTQQTRQNLHVSAIHKLQNQVFKHEVKLNLIDKSKPSLLNSGFRERNILVLIDGANFDHSCRQLKLKVDYRKFQQALIKQLVNQQVIKSKSSHLFLNFRYYIGEDQDNQQQQNFLKCLRHLGYTIVSKPMIWQQGKPKANVDVELSLDLVQLGRYYQTIILCSGDGDYLKPVRQMQTLGRQVIVLSLSSMTSQSLKETADFYLDLAQIKEQIFYQNSSHPLVA
ncbi:NYN domain-containing protein [Crocosphaera sp. XPORK-15E]|uniref:LabA-like NYN domain-containing protein n=1 Tax=Crocosphaera sp. XPORK-15E TaxID=3110247 RepID=UPI002B1F46A8|nr:NYN domain-containing protein [Crocosphaera sp. XPORK-15E]MEA5537327.1 NYN domain-containing protein [Crocosphaera sp. XPORK-15E]